MVSVNPGALATAVHNIGASTRVTVNLSGGWPFTRIVTFFASGRRRCGEAEPGPQGQPLARHTSKVSSRLIGSGAYIRHGWSSPVADAIGSETGVSVALTSESGRFHTAQIRTTTHTSALISASPIAAVSNRCPIAECCSDDLSGSSRWIATAYRNHQNPLLLPPVGRGPKSPKNMLIRGAPRPAGVSDGCGLGALVMSQSP
jgi:hypothetical protein